MLRATHACKPWVTLPPPPPPPFPAFPCDLIFCLFVLRRTTQKMASKYGEYTAEEFKPKSGFMSKVFGK